MPAGLEIYDNATGAVVFDGTTRNGKFVNTIYLTYPYSSYGDVPQLAQGYQLVWFIETTNGDIRNYPLVSVQDTSVTFAFNWSPDPDNPDDRPPPEYYIVHYGYY